DLIFLCEVSEDTSKVIQKFHVLSSTACFLDLSFSIAESCLQLVILAHQVLHKEVLN
ncbi:Hypothetical protein FKW44_003356, partial [Caligus rogercresseyi]